MSSMNPILTLYQSAEDTVTWTVQRLLTCGFLVERTFDLRAARLTHDDCICPYHGTKDCTCQMVVLLAHVNGLQPATIVAHGYDGRTSLSLVDLDNEMVKAKVIQALNLVMENSEI